MNPARSRFRIEAELAKVAEVRSRFGEFCDASDFVDDRTQAEVTLAVDEATTNIVRHGYENHEGVIDVEFEANGHTIYIRLWDDGIEREETDLVGLPPGVPGEGGMGINLMRAMLTSLDYSRENGRNLLVLRRDVTPREAAEDATEESDEE